MKRFVLCLCAAALGLAACTSPAPSATVEAVGAGTEPAATTSAADPCDKTNIQTTVKDYTDLMREFDDTSYVASFTPQGQLAQVILKLQDVRRRVQALTPPDCLKTLRKYQTDYMNAVVTALAHFLGGAKGDQVQAEIGATRTLRAKYDKELATVLGITFVAPTAQPQPSAVPGTASPASTTDTSDLAATPGDDLVTPGDDTATPDSTGTATPAATATPEAGTTAVVTVTQRANLRRGPSTDFALVATLGANETAKAVGRTSSGEWIQIENAAGPEGKAWLLASLVTVNVPVDQLPVVNPP